MPETDGGMTPEEQVVYILRSTLRDLPNDAAMNHIAEMIVAAVGEKLSEQVAELEAMVLVLATDAANDSFGSGANPALYIGSARERVRAARWVRDERTGGTDARGTD